MAETVTVYAGYVCFVSTVYDVALRCYTIPPRDVPTDESPDAVLIVSPQMAREVGERLREVATEYERRFGPLPVGRAAPESDGAEAPDGGDADGG